MLALTEGVGLLGDLLLLGHVVVVVVAGGGGGGRGRHGVGVVLRAPLVDEPDAALLPDPVRNLPRVDPHSELVWQDCEKILLGKTTVVACLLNQGVHFVVDPDTPVGTTFEWLLREPMVLVMRDEDAVEGLAKAFRLFHVRFFSQQVRNEVNSALKFVPHGELLNWAR